jgi:transposase-like protein
MTEMINVEAVNAVAMKKCSCKDCKDPVKPLSEFPKNKASKDGHSHWCKDCHKNYRKVKKMTAIVADDATGGVRGFNPGGTNG